MLKCWVYKDLELEKSISVNENRFRKQFTIRRVGFKRFADCSSFITIARLQSFA